VEGAPIESFNKKENLQFDNGYEMCTISTIYEGKRYGYDLDSLIDLR
jgi:hypothetical protein